MVKKITELTPEQNARMDEWADRWVEIGLCTEPVDLERFAAAAERAYGYADIPWPGNVVRVSSPLVGALAAPIADYILSSGGNDGAVGDAVGGAVGDAVYGAVDGAVGSAVGGAVADAVGNAVADAVGNHIKKNYYKYLGGQFWCGGWWYGSAMVTFFRDVCGLALAGDIWDRARAYQEINESTCWWWPNRRFVIVCDRPLAIHRELIDPARPRGLNSHRLHCATGPAIVWPDGWGVYVWHGVRVSKKLIMRPDEITAEDIAGETNAEVRMAMENRLGGERFSGLLKLVERDRYDYDSLYFDPETRETEKRPATYRLLETAEADEVVGEKLKFLKCVCPSTGKVYHQGVPPDTPDALAGAAWLAGLSADEYEPGTFLES